MTTSPLAAGFVARSLLSRCYLAPDGRLSPEPSGARLFATRDEARAAESLNGVLELDGRSVHAATAEDLGIRPEPAPPTGARLVVVRKAARENARRDAARLRMLAAEEDKRQVLDLIRAKGRANSADLRREVEFNDTRFYAALSRLKAERRAESYRIGHKIYWTATEGREVG